MKMFFRQSSKISPSILKMTFPNHTNIAKKIVTASFVLFFPLLSGFSCKTKLSELCYYFSRRMHHAPTQTEDAGEAIIRVNRGRSLKSELSKTQKKRFI